MQTQVDDNELIELIYASLLGESSWQAFLDRLAEAAPGCWSVLHTNDATGEEASVGLLSGRSADDVVDYPTYYHGVSPWAPHCHARPGGKATVVEDYVPRHELERSEFYNDFLRPIGTRSAIGIGVNGSDGQSLLISLMTPDAKEEDLIPLARQLERISPHLQRAGEFYRQTSFAARATELGATFFDALQLGVVVIGTGRRVRTSSDQARRLFGRDVGIDPMGRLRLSDPVAQTVLIAMLGAKYVGPRTHRLPVGNLMVTMIRMEGSRERSLFEGPGVCLTMEAISGGGRFFDMDRFCRAYGLTPGEIRVLTGLIAGKSVAEIAREAGRSRETIRSQLKSLCLKTGASGQADLMRVVSGMKV